MATDKQTSQSLEAPSSINWNSTKADAALITKICKRYETEVVALFGKLPSGYERLNLDMDLTACHCNGCALDLPKLLDAPRFDFLHDLGGISEHLDRKTGRLTHCFVPRCAKPVVSK